jgi:signal transduction histidine kinase
LSGFLESRLLRRDAELSRDFAQSIVDIQQVSAAFETGQADQDARFVEFFAHLAAMPDVLRANVYSPTREVLWSSRPEIIGHKFIGNSELEEALSGAVVAHVDDEAESGAKAEHVFLNLRSDEFVENYLPVYGKESKKLLGVVELYRRPTALLETIRSGTQLVWLGAFAGGTGLFLALVWFVRRIDRSLRAQQARLVESEALAMVGELSAAIAHSIRNPLGSIRSSAELQRELGPGTPIDVDDVIHQVDRIDHLVRTLLTYARETPEHPRSCDLAQVLRTASAQFAHGLERQGKPFETEWPEQLGEVGMDEVLLLQVMSSVLANASEATVRGERIRLSARPQGGGTVIFVEDEGPGIEARHVGQVSQAFFTTKPRGLGLGLSLARRAAERIGGQLRIESLARRGTRVSLWLPQLHAAGTIPPPKSDPVEEHPR